MIKERISNGIARIRRLPRDIADYSSTKIDVMIHGSVYLMEASIIVAGCFDKFDPSTTLFLSGLWLLGYGIFLYWSRPDDE